jgi:predicted Zn-dependent protease
MHGHLAAIADMTTARPLRPSKLPRWRAGLLAALLALSGPLAPPVAAQSLPALGDGVEVSMASERRLGDRIATDIYRNPAWLDDAVLGDYLQAIWQPLMQAALRRGDLSAELQERFAWQLFLVRDRSVNAFALPGGYLGVHTGLIAAVSTADELAAVLAHELSHVTQRHIARIFTQQQNMAPWMMAAMILGVMAAISSPDAASAAILGGQAVAAQGQLNFSRDMEREADRVGFGILLEAGFGSEGAAAMFEKLQQASRFNDNGAFPYLRSHPLTSERIAEARTRQQSGSAGAAPRTAPHTALPNLARHAMMGGRARVLGDSSPDALQTRLDQARDLRADASPEQRLSVLYAATLAAARLRQAPLARDLLGQLMALAAGQPQVGQAARLLAIEVDALLGDASQAATRVSWSSPVTRAELLVQGQVLVQAGRPEQASERLQSWVSVHPRDAGAWALLAQALHAQGQRVQAVRAEAESRSAQFDYQGAVDRLKAAQDLLRSSTSGVAPANLHIEASIVDTRARQMQALLREQMLQERTNR